MTQKFEHIQPRKLMVVSKYLHEVFQFDNLCIFPVPSQYLLCSAICNKYVTKKKEKLLGFSFLQKIKTHYQIFEKIKKRSLVKL